MIYRDRDEYEEKEMSVPQDAFRELLDGDEDEIEKADAPESEEEGEKEWE